MMGNFSNQKYTFQNTPEGLVIAGIEPLVGYIFDTAVLIVQHANKQPPHIAIGYKRLYFSLSVKGPEVEIDLETRIQNLSKLKVPTIFFSLSEPVTQLSKMSVSGLFNAYRPLQAGETCLAPIIDFFQAAYSIQPSKELIFGLLEELHEKQLIRSVNQLQLEGFLIHGNETTLAFYTPEIVRQRIENLLEKKKSQTD